MTSRKISCNPNQNIPDNLKIWLDSFLLLTFFNLIISLKIASFYSFLKILFLIIWEYKVSENEKPLVASDYTLKKLVFLRNPSKRLRRCQKASKCVKILKETIFWNLRNLKGSYGVSRWRTISRETLLCSVKWRKRFHRKIRNLQGSLSSPKVS